MPEINGVIETCLYVSDLARSTAFYEQTLGLRRMTNDERFCAFSVAGRHVLLLFQQGTSNQPLSVPGGVIPPHDGTGPVHLGFAVSRESLPDWETALAAHRIEIESRVTWPRGGKSIYFRDPDRHLLELLSPGVWPIY